MNRPKPVEPKTTCGKHRVDGYHLMAGQWVCRSCGLPQWRHETISETLARNEIEQRAANRQVTEGN